MTTLPNLVEPKKAPYYRQEVSYYKADGSLGKTLLELTDYSEASVFMNVDKEFGQLFGSRLHELGAKFGQNYSKAVNPIGWIISKAKGYPKLQTLIGEIASGKIRGAPIRVYDKAPEAGPPAMLPLDELLRQLIVTLRHPDLKPGQIQVEGLVAVWDLPQRIADLKENLTTRNTPADVIATASPAMSLCLHGPVVQTPGRRPAVTGIAEATTAFLDRLKRSKGSFAGSTGERDDRVIYYCMPKQDVPKNHGDAAIYLISEKDSDRTFMIYQGPMGPETAKNEPNYEDLPIEEKELISSYHVLIALLADHNLQVDEKEIGGRSLFWGNKEACDSKSQSPALEVVTRISSADDKTAVLVYEYKVLDAAVHKVA